MSRISQETFSRAVREAELRALTCDNQTLEELATAHGALLRAAQEVNHHSVFAAVHIEHIRSLGDQVGRLMQAGETAVRERDEERAADGL